MKKLKGEAMAEKSIFRDKSIERVTSPEQLNDYIKVTTPSVWLILGAIGILIAGAVIWAVCGTIEVNTEEGVKAIAPISYLIK